MKSGEGGPDAAKAAPGSEPEVTPLPAPMPGLSMEMEALEPEEPSLAPLAKLPGVVARTGQGSGKKLKATHSPGGKSSAAKGAAGTAGTAGGGRGKTPERSDKSGPNDKGGGKTKPAATSAKDSASAPPAAAPRIAAKTEAPTPPPPVLAMPETLPLSPAAVVEKPSERSRAWWAIGALGLVALGAGVGALLWQPAPQPPTAPTEAPATVAAAPPRTALTVTPIEPTNPGGGPPGVPVPVVEALPAPTAAPAAPTAAVGNAPTGDKIAANTTAVPAAAQPAAATPRTTSKPAPTTAPAPTAKPTPKAATPATSVATGKPGGEPAGKAPGKPLTKPAATASATPLSLEPVPQLSPPIIRQHMLAAEKRFPGCVREGFGSNVSIGIVVESAGTVRKADILGPLGQSATGRCISEQIRGLRFPPFTEGGTTKFFVWSYQVPQAN